MNHAPLDNFKVRTYAYIIVQLGGSCVEFYCEMYPTMLEALERIDEFREASHDALGPFESDGVLLKHRAAIIPMLNTICSAVSAWRTQDLRPLLALALEKFKKDREQQD